MNSQRRLLKNCEGFSCKIDLGAFANDRGALKGPHSKGGESEIRMVAGAPKFFAEKQFNYRSLQRSELFSATFPLPDGSQQRKPLYNIALSSRKRRTCGIIV